MMPARKTHGSVTPGPRDAQDPLGGALTRTGMFLTWERHQRTRSLVAHLGLALREIVVPGPRYRRYWGQIAATLRYLRRERPDLVFLQNPSLLLNVLVLCWRALTRAKCLIVMDAHNEAVEPVMVTWRWWRAMAAWAVRHSDFTIVTNRFLAEKVKQLGGRPLVLPDPVPDVVPSAAQTLAPDEPLRLLVVATYAKDEPIEPILEAARLVQGQIEFRFTGNFRKLPEKVLASAPPNVKFLGFLAEHDYWEQMRHAHAVLDFTLMEDCLVCGAYEAVAVGRPMVLSDTRALKEYFRQGALYSSAEPGAIASAVHRLRTEYDQLSEQIAALRPILQTEWSACRSQAESVIIAAITRKAF
jgi:glycosyltransferase involved in cell wall biosynthesis